MTIRLSTGLRNFLADKGSLKKALEDGVLMIYSGSQPATANDAIGSATLLAKISKASATFTEGAKSTAKTASVCLAGTPTNGSTARVTLTTCESASPVNYDVSEVTGTSLSAHAALIAAAINLGQKSVLATVVDDGDTNIAGVHLVFTSLFAGVGFTVAVTAGTMTLTLDAEVLANVRGNGLQMGQAATGILAKDAEVWSGVGITPGGTAGWFRFQGNDVDNDASSATLIRMDGSIGASTGDLIIPTTVQTGATITIDTCNLTIPANA